MLQRIIWIFALSPDTKACGGEIVSALPALRTITPDIRGLMGMAKWLYWLPGKIGKAHGTPC